MSGMRAQEELPLQPNRVGGGEAIAMLQIVLEANFRKFAVVPGEVRRDAPVDGALGISPDNVLILCPADWGHIIAAQRGDPAFFEAIGDLRVEAPILYGFSRKRRNRGV